MKNFQVFLFSIITFTIISCYIAPLPIYRLEPKSDKTAWFWGKEYQQLQQEEIEITIAFSEQYKKYLVFDLSIKILLITIY